MRSRSLTIALIATVLVVASAGAQPTAAAACGSSDVQCDLRQRVAAAEQYVANRPGTIGFVLRDRTTGARYRNANAGTPIWTASTIKLAMVADLLTRERAGAIRLSDADRRLMVAMLRSSDNAAADTLWSRYGGPAQAFNADFPRYGMPNIRPQPGFGDVFPYWGFQKATADDFDGLMNYVLTGLTPPDATAVVAEMQRVDGRTAMGGLGRGSRDDAG